MSPKSSGLDYDMHKQKAGCVRRRLSFMDSFRRRKARLRDQAFI
jgi:hypothetical protein